MHIDEPLSKYRVTNSAVALHAVTLKKSACACSPAFALRLTATENEVTESPEGVVLSSGFAQHLPARITLFRFRLANCTTSLPYSVNDFFDSDERGISLAVSRSYDSFYRAVYSLYRFFLHVEFLVAEIFVGV